MRRLFGFVSEMFKNYGAEKYGPHSVCLLQKSAFVMEQCERKLSYPDWGSGCYQVNYEFSHYSNIYFYILGYN